MRRPNARPRASRRDPSSEMPSQPRVPRISRRCCRFPCCLVAAAVVVITGAPLLYLFVFSSSNRFGIIIDGGSTGTRIHVFGYRKCWGGMPVIDLGYMSSMKVVPGLSAYADNPVKAAESLTELIGFGKHRLPQHWWGETEIRLMATAGLRLLDVDKAEAILDSCRSVLRGSGFKFLDDWASIIPGADEGIYAWVTANYALGTLGKEAQLTIGIIELGGASAQIAFVPSEPVPKEFSHELKFGQASYQLYSHSFLQLGQNVAHEYLQHLLNSGDLKISPEFLFDGVYRDPCTPKGYLHGVDRQKLSGDAFSSSIGYNRIAYAVGNFSECRSAAKMLLQKGKDRCSYKHCRVGSTYIPKLQGRFIATENFFHTSKFFGLDPSSFISDLMLAGAQFCEEDWLMLRRKYHNLEEEDLLRYCFSSAYIVALLHDSLGFEMNGSRIVFANQVGEVPLDWALGAFIMMKAAEGVEHPELIEFIISSIPSQLPPVFVITFILAFTALLILKWCRAQNHSKNYI
ncbi:putative apyrase 6 [Apostasia shenzhenica]|uniref:Putative apyrase 6 n=1 Tax=Apostasia shenzhenica TaxID=1088818 RepID=A0A2H9ZUX6_9ASPA|nr:putative apyrase 6 [Apostasia shenzhenica]